MPNNRQDSNNPLKKFASNKTSQYGEDGILKEVFRILPQRKERWSVEFGAWDGKYMSNTYELVQNQNWHGVFIEASKAKFVDLKKTFRNNTKTVLINELVHFEGSNTLDEILSKTGIPREFDLLSIDIDGCDYYIWESLKDHLPQVVCIEFNPSIPSDIEFVQKKNFKINHGNSLLSTVNLAKTKGYELIATTWCNAIFVRKEHYDLFKIEDNTPSSMWTDEQLAPRLFELFDGTLMLSQPYKSKWSNVEISQRKLQIFPKALRIMGDSTSRLKFMHNLKLVYGKLMAPKNDSQ